MCVAVCLFVFTPKRILFYVSFPPCSKICFWLAKIFSFSVLSFLLICHCILFCFTVELNFCLIIKYKIQRTQHLVEEYIHSLYSLYYMFQRIHLAFISTHTYTTYKGIMFLRRGLPFTNSDYLYTGSGHSVVLYYKIHNICSYSQTQLSIMSLIKITHLATGFDQTRSSSGHIYTKIKEVHGLRCKCRS